VVDEKRRPRPVLEPCEPDSSTSGEYVRKVADDREPFRAKSTKRRALRPEASGTPTAPVAEAPLPGSSPNEEQTPRAGRPPQRIRMSLRMRRVAAGSSSDAASALGTQDAVVLRLGGRDYELALGQQLLAGRAAECQISLGDRLCSRRHAVFSRDADGGASVRDLGSTNGTYVNGVRLQAPLALSRGDWITLGNETLELSLAAATKPAESPTIPAGPRAGQRRGPRAAGAQAERASARTDPGSPLLSLASYAALAEHDTPAQLGAADVRKPLDELLRRVEQGERPAEQDARMATLVALHMAGTTTDATWLHYGLCLYTALRLPWGKELLARLSELHPRLRPARSPAARAQLDALEQSGARDWDAGQRRDMARLRALCEPLLTRH
jgi:hypothetical protein